MVRLVMINNSTPTCVPGKADGDAGKVVASYSYFAFGKINNTAREPSTDSMEIRHSNPQLLLPSANLLCYNDSSGWAKATVSGGIEPYKYARDLGPRNVYRKT
ncbi:MAG: SprB repeat-containing protein [Desulfobacterales bacterium]|nr:SprB repeat-containing protein [Desulfobacterales bacterium]